MIKKLWLLIVLGHLALNADIKPLSDTMRQEMLVKNVWREGCPISLDRLRVVTFPYCDFLRSTSRSGELIVLDAVAQKVFHIFNELYRRQFPLAKAQRIEFYNADDELSMAANNSSSFNCRALTYGSTFSLHAYGLAIDINPVQNPYLAVSDLKILPPEGAAFINRANLREGMAEHISDIFNRNGFTIWGGRWNNPIDWQHFQVPRSLAELLAAMSPEHAALFFEHYALNNQILEGKTPALYRDNPDAFMHELSST
jgi:hypothetical protein